MTDVTGIQVVRSFLKVQPGEERTVVLMFLYSLAATGGPYVIGRTVSRSLFLSNLSPEVIPYRYLAVAIGTVLAASLYQRVVLRYRRDKLIIGSYTLMGFGLLVFRLLLEAPWGENFAVLGGLFVYFEVVAALVNIQFWTFAADIFSPREAKRLFTIVVAGATLSNVLGGIFVRIATPLVGTTNLIFFVTLSLLGCVACVWALRQKYLDMQASSTPRGSTLHTHKPKHSTSFLENVRIVVRVPLLVSIMGIVVLTTFVFNVVDYQFDLALKQTFGADEDQMSIFLSSFFFWGGIAACVIQFLLVNVILTRFGIVGGLLVYPTGIVLGSISILASSASLLAVALTRATDVAFRYTIDVTTLNLLYLPVPRDARAQAKAIIDGILRPTIMALAGLMFLFVGNVVGLTITVWSVPVLILVAIWVALVFRARRQYVLTLTANIKGRRIDLDAETIDLSDETTVQVLTTAMQGRDHAQVLHALELIRDMPNVDWTPCVAALLQHPATEIRIAALRYLSRRGTISDLPLVAELLKDSESSVRAAAIEAVCAMAGPKAVSRIVPFLDDPDPTIKASAVAGLMTNGGLEGVLHASERLKQMLESDQSNMRLMGAQVLGALQAPSFYHPLLALFEDPNKAVQNRAIEAAGKLRSHELLPILLEKLEQSATRTTATEALVRYGAGIEFTLGDALSDTQRTAAARAQLPRILQRIETQQSADVLSVHWQESNEKVRTAVFEALARLRLQLDFKIDTDTVRQAIFSEIRQSYALRTMYEDLEVEGRSVLLEDALQARLNCGLNRILYLLCMLHPDRARTIDSVRLALTAGRGRAQSDAVEVLDNLINRDVRELLLPLVEAPVAQVLQIAQRRFGIGLQSKTERLVQLAHSSDSWLRACAIYAIGELKLTELYPSVQSATLADDALVRETAQAVSRHITLSADSIESVNFRKGNQRMALSTIEKVLFLKSVPLFDQLASEQLTGVAQIVQQVEFEPGEMFIRQGDDGDCLYIIVDGQVVIFIEGLGQVDYAESKGVLGETGILSGSPRNASCRAATLVVALKLERDDFWELMGEQPQIALGIVKVLINQLETRTGDLRKLHAEFEKIRAQA